MCSQNTALVCNLILNVQRQLVNLQAKQIIPVYVSIVFHSCIVMILLIVITIALVILIIYIYFNRNLLVYPFWG